MLKEWCRSGLWAFCIFCTPSVLAAQMSAERVLRDSAEKYTEEVAFKLYQHSFEYQVAMDSALRISPNWAAGYRHKARPYLFSGDYANFMKYMQPAVENDYMELGYRGWCRLYFIKDYEGAIADLELLDKKTVDFDDFPMSENLFYLTGLAKKEMGNFADALVDFNKSVASQSKNKGEEWVESHTWFYRGVTYFEMSEYEKALEDFYRTLKYDANSSDALFYMALTFEKLHRTSDICPLLRNSFEKFNKGFVHKDGLADVPNQLYLSDLEEKMKQYCDY